jgi:pre-mRNA-splicing factor RBM22/SLT11
MLCETCLGQNPYVRMVKLPFGQKLCKISTAPYQGFRWKAGPQGRYKETIISYAVAKERNICQTCLNDMKYGLPVGVRDRLLSQPDNQLALPQSDVGQRYFYEQQAQMAGTGDGSITANFSTDMQNMAPSRTLDKFARAKQVIEARSKTAFRNLPKLCSFWMNGTCSRVLRKTCPFRPCCGSFVFPEIAGSAREICQKLIKSLEADGPAAVMKSMDSETKDAIRESLKGNREEAIRKRVSGEDDLTKKYLGKMDDMVRSLNCISLFILHSVLFNMPSLKLLFSYLCTINTCTPQHLELAPPDDPTVTTLWLGNVDADISEGDLREVMYPYGHIQNVHLVRASKCAFVEFASREMAENAAKELYRAMIVKDKVINVNWSKPRAQDYVQGGGSTQSSDSGPTAMLPPPGMEKAPTSAYLLPGMPIPFMPPPPMGLPPSDTGSYFLNHQAPRPAQPVAMDGQEATVGSKRPAGDMAIAGGLDGFADTKRMTQSQPKAPASLYPSMNPSRMGAKI